MERIDQNLIRNVCCDFFMEGIKHPLQVLKRCKELISVHDSKTKVEKYSSEWTKEQDEILLELCTKGDSKTSISW